MTDQLLELAHRQHGVVSRPQVRDLGFSVNQIDRRIKSRMLNAVFPGTYSVGHSRLTLQGQWMAGVLAAGPGAALSHRSAGAHWGFLAPGREIDALRPWSPESACIKTLQSSSPFGRRLHIRRSRVFGPAEWTRHNSIRTTTVARTLLDLSAILTIEQLDSALSEAERAGLVRISELRKMARRGRGWTGVGKLREVVNEWDPSSVFTKSELEKGFRRLCRNNSIPLPETNVLVEGFEVDCFWPSHALIVELDSYRHHRSPRAMDRDQERSIVLEERGYRVVRLGHRMVTDHPQKTVQRLKTWLS